MDIKGEDIQSEDSRKVAIQNENQTTENPSSYKLKRKRISIGRPYICKKCYESFQLRSDLQAHMDNHSRKYQCVPCKKTFQYKTTLLQHQAEVHCEKPYQKWHTSVQCGICGVLLNTNASFNEHHETFHRGFDVECKCVDCGLVFKRLHNLKYHQKIHEKPLVFKCTICDRSFVNAFILEKHNRTVHPENGYKCKQCDQRFPSNVLLVDHSRIHKELRKFECHICEEGFNEVMLLNVHYKVHHTGSGRKVGESRAATEIQIHKAEVEHPKGDKILEEGSIKDEPDKGDSIEIGSYDCHQCDAVFDSFHELENHGKAHIIKVNDDYIQIFECVDCKAVFESSEDLEKHSKVHIKTEDM